MVLQLDDLGTSIQSFQILPRVIKILQNLSVNLVLLSNMISLGSSILWGLYGEDTQTLQENLVQVV